MKKITQTIKAIKTENHVSGAREMARCMALLETGLSQNCRLISPLKIRLKHSKAAKSMKYDAVLPFDRSSKLKLPRS